MKHCRAISFLKLIGTEAAECGKELIARGVLILPQILTENLVGYIYTKGIIQRYKDREGRLNLKAIEDELDERLHQKHFKASSPYQKSLYNLLYNLTTGIKRASPCRKRDLIDLTFSEFMAKKKQNSGSRKLKLGKMGDTLGHEPWYSGSGSELSEMLKDNFQISLSSHQAIDDIPQLVEKYVEALQADILLEILLSMRYTLHNFLLLINKTKTPGMYNINLPVLEKDIRDNLGQVNLAKHRRNVKVRAGDVNRYFQTFNRLLDKLSEKPHIDACLNIDKLVSISGFSLAKYCFAYSNE